MVALRDLVVKRKHSRDNTLRVANEQRTVFKMATTSINGEQILDFYILGELQKMSRVFLDKTDWFAARCFVALRSGQRAAEFLSLACRNHGERSEKKKKVFLC